MADTFRILRVTRLSRILGFVLAASILCCCNCGFAARGRVFSVRTHGVANDGSRDVTAALQKILDEAAAAGGGTVVLDPGVYLSGALFLKSHTHLAISPGAVLMGTTEKSAYPLVATRAAGIEMQWPAALLNIDNQTDVSIEGAGTIDGNGRQWWDAFWSRVPAYEERGLRWAVDYDVQRPELIRIYNSHAVRVGKGLLLRRSAFWTVHICYSSHVVVSGVTIRDNDGPGGLGPSTDGVDIDSSRHVLVEKVDIENNDDAICLKAGMNADGQRVNRPTEDVVIRDSIVREGISAIAIGSDTAGGFRNIRIQNIKILHGVRYGIYFKSTHTRGGWTENVRLSDVAMEGVKTAIMVDLDYFPAFSTPRIPVGIEKNLPPDLKAIPEYWHVLSAPVAPERGLPHFRDIRLTRITAQHAGYAFQVNAAPEAPLERFKLKDLHLDAEHAGSIRHTKGWTLRDVRVISHDGHSLVTEDMQDCMGAVQQGK